MDSEFTYPIRRGNEFVGGTQINHHFIGHIVDADVDF